MTKQIVLITGCSKGGIGYALSQKFAQEGHHVIATTRNVDALEGLEAFGCEKEALDINDQNSINTVVQKVIDRVGHIDVLVNNAGAPAVGALMDIDLQVAHQCVNTNVFGTLAMSRAVAIHMAKQGSGKIVNIGSVVGYVSTPWAGIYALSKAAVHSMSDTLRLELKPFGIQVVVVAPGAIKSNFGNAGAKIVNVPEDSLYASIAKFIIARANMSQSAGNTPNEVFARHVVKKITQPVSPKYITYGATSWVFLLFYYLPFFIKDLIFYRKFGLNQLKPKKD
ncbi:WD repeat protein Lub1 [Mucor velutinosus]|uniref:WD repeat protein Lub1 n=1 Tax=Mucor velutinosus TaxID=708070 RepID=A0AAN7HZT8_9FUNG|nr:WD repeat protein Lub1 [Mucor velutinosus]